METFVGVGNNGFPSSLVFGINGNIAITAKLSREMRILSRDNMEVPPGVSPFYWNDT